MEIIVYATVGRRAVSEFDIICQKERKEAKEMLVLETVTGRRS